MFFFLIKTAHAIQTVTVAESDLGFSPPNVNDVITFIIRFLFIVAGLVAILFLILGAISWITAGGNKENVDKAREKIQNAVIGLVLVFIVIGIVVLLETILFPDQPTGQKCGLGISKPICMPKLIQPPPPAGGGRNGCFLAGTKITTKTGPKNIEDISKEDIIISYNLTNNKRTESKIKELLIHKNTADSYLIFNSYFKVTPNHRIWVVNKRDWLKAEEIVTGDELMNFEGKKIKIISKEEKKLKERITVYDLKLEGNDHNYFADNFLVHNK